MPINAEIFSQGEELITGQTIDSNSAWISEQLITLGFKVRRHTTVGDNLADLITLLQEIARRADFCICTGGLGPTCDDLTAAAVAEAFQLPLVQDPIALAQISDFFSRRQRTMPEVNAKQALLPTGAIRIDNHWGTAPGFALYQQQCWFAFLPGVPSEMQNMFAASVKTWLQNNFIVQPRHAVAIKTLGIGESAIQQRIQDIVFPDDVHLGFCAGIDEVKTKLDFPADYTPDLQQPWIETIVERLGETVFAVDTAKTGNTRLPDVINTLLQPGGQTLAVIETISQGLIAAKCIAQPWLVQSSYFSRYQHLATLYHLDLNEDLITAAKKLAQREQQRTQADMVLLQLSDTGGKLCHHAAEQSVQLYNVLLSNQDYHTENMQVTGTLQRIQNQSALLALDFLRRYLQRNKK